ncbi:hypothetical protein K461DRAFT_301386 [Myriangium duriaei CBS 260.36]|uniref:Uncharacterized protein n=1 Tax=Myriangium duriaei CBS 260.36 TaxID=1168546 RepID=A0A9P4IRG7_9PEZI|nr:hypothetical protein K461DRAFT_301386 [Myriangium duriaei CBS 260.36]
MTSGLSPRDIQLLAIGFRCSKSPIEIDWDKFVTLSGLKNIGSAKTTFGNLKKKLDATADQGEHQLHRFTFHTNDLKTTPTKNGKPRGRPPKRASSTDPEDAAELTTPKRTKTDKPKTPKKMRYERKKDNLLLGLNTSSPTAGGGPDFAAVNDEQMRDGLEGIPWYTGGGDDVDEGFGLGDVDEGN